MVNASLVVLRLREPGRRRPFRVPGAVGRVPVLPVLGSGLLLAHFDASTYVGGGAALAAALAFYAVGARTWQRRDRRRRATPG